MYELLWALTNACWRKELWQFLFLTRDLCLASLASYLQKKINSLFQIFTIQHPNTHLRRVWPFEWHLLILTLLLLKIMLHQFHLSVVQGNGKLINQANTWLLWAVHKLCRQNINKEGSHWWLLIEKLGISVQAGPGPAWCKYSLPGTTGSCETRTTIPLHTESPASITRPGSRRVD